MRTSDLFSSQRVFQKFLGKTQYDLSMFSFVNIFSWKDFFDFEFKVIGGALCVFAKHELGSFLYLPPLGKALSLGLAEKCFGILFTMNQGRGISRIENVEEKDLGVFSPEKYTIYHKSDEFVYRRSELEHLAGNKYKSKRALYNQCARSKSCVFIPYRPSMKKECLQVYRRWAKERKERYDDDIYRQMIDENLCVHDTCLSHYQKLGLVGRVVLIDGKIHAYTFGFDLKQDVFCVLLEVADRSVKGLSTYIFREMCRDTQIKRFDFINVMDDFGLENIRATKLLFKPCRIHPSYVVSPKASCAA